MRLITNAGLFQVAWWTAALLNNSGLMVLLLLFILLIATNQNKKHLLTDLSVVLPIMLVVEQVLIVLNVFKYTAGTLPFYIVLLWFCLVATLRVSLNFLFTLKQPIGFLVTLVFSSLSYFAAAKLGAVSIDISLLVFFPGFGFIWATSLFLSAYLSSSVYQRIFQNGQ